MRAAALGAIALLAEAGRLTVPGLLVLAALLGSGAVMFELAYPAYVPGLVAAGGRLTLLDANARLDGAAKGAQLGGPIVAGLLVQLLTAPVALVLNAGSFLASVVAVSAIRSQKAPPARHPRRGG